MAYEKFKIYMLSNNIKQKEIADLIGITESNVSLKINKKNQDFTKKQIEIICNFYNISPDEYFFN